MIDCREALARLHPYIDGETTPADEMAFEAHLLECASCRAEYESLREVVDTVRGSKPLYPVDPSVRARVTQLVERSQLRKRKRVAVMAGVFAATLILFSWLPSIEGQRFTSFAASAHERYSQRALPLDVVSDQPAIVSAWLHTHLPFHFALPDFKPLEVKSYSLVGAQLLKFNGQEVAYLAYTMKGRPISLLVSSRAAVLSGSGQTYRSGNLDFHFSSENGLKLITWRDRGLSYALVSDVQVEGAQSCVVCHGSLPELRRVQ